MNFHETITQVNSYKKIMNRVHLEINILIIRESTDTK